MEINNNRNFNNNIFFKIKNILNQNLEPKTQNNNPSSSQPLNEFNLTTEENLKLILSTTGILPSEKNMNVVELMLNSLIPINKENFKMVSDNLNLFESQSFEKLEVLLKNNLELNKDNSNQLENYLLKEINLNEQISELFSTVDNSNDLSNIIKIFTKDDNLAHLSKNLFNKLDNIKNELVLNLSKNQEVSEKITQNLNEIISENNTLENIYSKSDSIEYNFLKAIFSQNNTLKNSTSINDLSSNLISSENIDLKNLIEISLPTKLIFDKKALLLIENKINEQFLSNSNLENSILENTEKLIFKEINLKEFNNILPKIYKFQEKLAEKTSFDFKNSTSEDLNNFICNIKENLNLTKSYLKEVKNSEINNEIDNEINNEIDNEISNKINNEINSKINNEINKTLDNINNNLNFMSALKDTTFLQIPLNINNHQTTAELFLFKNKNNKKNNKLKNSGSALLSLDLANLGHIETYIVKFNSDISCQFRLSNIKIQNFIKENIEILNMYLKEKSLNLKEISFKEINESFTLISKEPNKQDSKNKLNFNTFNKQI